MTTKSAPLTHYLHLVSEHLSHLLPKLEGPSKTLNEAAYYSLLSGGKRIRPLLPLLILAGHHQKIEPFLDPLCSLELIHTYSLIHDDLPCMDDDDFRRGKPSLHKAFTEATAILTGDFLLTYAFELIAKNERVPAEDKMDLILSLSSFAGSLGLIGGQMEDLAHSLQTVQEVETMYAKKTSALFSCALDFGALLSQDRARRNELILLGYHMGIAYQYLDDLEDRDGIQGFLSEKLMKERCSFHFGEMQKICSHLPSSYQYLTSYLFTHLFSSLS